ncbi:MAG: winged helix-turn-helix transcriptional regulator [Thermoplasmata archaeon]
METSLDELDFEILKILKVNSRISNRTIAKKLSVSVPTITDHIKKMEINGIIKRYTVEIGQEDWLFDFFLISKTYNENINIKKTLFNIKGIYAIYKTMGQGDLIIHIKIRNKDELSIIQNKIKKYGDIISIYPVLSNDVNISENLENNIKAKCSYCGKEIYKDPVKLKTVYGTRIFCCNTCKESYKQKYLKN